MHGFLVQRLLERHHIQTRNVSHVVEALRGAGVEVRVVRRQEYDQETVRWADAIVSAGGGGTMLLVAGKVFDKDTPVIGVNTDPEKWEGHLCLPYTHAFPEALAKQRRGEFRWLWRHHSRLYLEGTGINPTPVDLHEMQLSLEQQSQSGKGDRFGFSSWQWNPCCVNTC